MSTELVVDLESSLELQDSAGARVPMILHAVPWLLGGFLVAGVIWMACTSADLVVTAAGRVRALSEPVTVHAPSDMQFLGAVRSVEYREGDVVRAGDMLARLDTEKLEIERARLMHAMETAERELQTIERMHILTVQQVAAEEVKFQAQLTAVQNEIREKTDRRMSELREAETHLESQRKRCERVQQLTGVKALSPQVLEDELALLEQAEERLLRARLPVADDRIDVLEREQTVSRQEYDLKVEQLHRDRLVQQQRISAAQKDLDRLRMESDQATFRAPCPGVIVSPAVEPGQSLRPGEVVLQIAPQEGFAVELAVATSDVGELRVGMPAKIKLDAYDFQYYGVAVGRVTHIAPDSRIGGVPAKETSQRAMYVVRVDLEKSEVGRGEHWGRIKLGLIATGEIVIKRETLLQLLFKTIRHSISLA